MPRSGKFVQRQPAGLFRLTGDNWFEVLGERPTDALWGIGRKTAKKLAEVGLVTVAQLARADPTELAERFGPTMGPWYRLLALEEPSRVYDLIVEATNKLKSQ